MERMHLYFKYMIMRMAISVRIDTMHGSGASYKEKTDFRRREMGIHNAWDREFVLLGGYSIMR